MNYLQFEFQTTNNVEHEILLALLADAGFEGFEEHSQLLYAFIKESLFSQEIFDEILAIVPVQYSKKLIESTNWNAIWESSFEPVRVGNFAAVRASFHNPIKDVLHEIIITPKMSFGTGHHATTWMMMEQMSNINFTGKSVYDFGTGTGVLAILAAKLGAQSIIGIDNDEWSIENAKENIAANDTNQILVELGTTIPSNEKFDIILANINLHVLLNNMPSMSAACQLNGLLLLSGILSTDKAEMEKCLIENCFTLESCLQQKEWICLLARKN